MTIKPTPKNKTNIRRTPRLWRPAIGVACTILAVLWVSAAVTQADQMTVFSCHDPAGNAVGHDGWTAARTNDLFLTLADTCTAADQGALVLGLAANASGYQNLARAEWIFTAPPWATIAGYNIQITGSYAIPSTGGGMGQTFVKASDENDPVYDYRNLGEGSRGAYTISRTPPAPVNWIATGASCDGQDGPCPANVLVSQLEVSSTAILLNDSTTPTVTNLSGPLVSGASLRGTAEATFDAADSGPGVYSGHLIVDGQNQPATVLDSNNGWCQNLGQTSNATRSFAHPDPCAQSTSASLTLDTTTLHDGQHTLKLLVDDAAGNSTTAYNATITTNNAPANTTTPTITPTQVSLGDTLTAQPGNWTAPPGAGNITYTYQWQDCTATTNECTPIPGATNTTYTPTPSDTSHTLRLQVTATDNDGSATTTSAPTSSVPAPPNPPGTNQPTGIPGSENAASTPTSVLTAGLGAPNGTAASETAQLRLAGHHTISRSYAQRAFTASGQLLNSQGQPITAARLDVLQQTLGASTMTLIEHTSTHQDGSFSVRIPPGPSRLIEIAYRAYANDSTYTTQGQVQENVSASVLLTITPRRTSPTGTITLNGQVQGPIPQHGVLVELLVRYLGHWQPFRTPRTNNKGHFTIAYQFQGATGHFPFKAQAPGGQTGFAYTTGYSRQININTH
jgi:hypothetical protein